VEWFANLFDNRDEVLRDDAPSGRYGVSRGTQADALSRVFSALDADAPNTGRKQNNLRALEGFAAIYDLRQSDAMIGFANDTHHEIALLSDPSRISCRHRPDSGPDAPRFDADFPIDIDIDDTGDIVRFSKSPLELELTIDDTHQISIIGVHLKSKAPHGAETRDAIIRQAIANRRKQMAQAIWLRRRIDRLLARGNDLIVLGDLNDGPGLDEFEELFGRSSVEIVLGDDLYDAHARQAMMAPLGPGLGSSRFLLRNRNRYLRAFLDYIMIFPSPMNHRPA